MGLKKFQIPNPNDPMFETKAQSPVWNFGHWNFDII
jgi:hypothetical protein